ncbi:nucleotidyl transferase AbiEii/AbiGii toxin family protein [Pectobacterium quasiaquaticum]|uniref:nucleotidyl transferase AbiEii/AbiGii toxin family protein n=1 Tax=Pectobacterium quasiaquaticum TaxID=2774015 RepID=UPI001876A3B5|nr:nucleotidyl transferase AbiEii/AbiGii toxin family protein [Pectobacterium quasiaquaticum]MBE5215205.1 nucleotidyl transferase AbiEii/AbiGii toxin family protein [Pectobacterium quasiaquaticum]MBE5224633.1 nucleotidyl transferase AbiEii/AbiGii toxin family protein [Pectobacterium quasiaquaticum]URG52086.1 nucleotidyl transferase AbiEii/AbiGii toxin family protein [Pectobacterium quasiaquaticum]
MNQKVNFAELVSKAVESAELEGLRNVVEKELLHYDILYCLDNAGLLEQLTFQGGTSLRLCHGANRFSEDLDFAGGVAFSGADLRNMKACIEDYLGNRYGLEVNVKEPNELRNEPGYEEVRIDKWQVSVTTAPEKRDMPRQRIKIEIANIPAYTRAPMTLKRNYEVLPDGYSDTLVMCETLNEVMCDKLVSLVATTKYIRYRDVWDLPWLIQQNATYDIDLIRKKIQDYRIPNYDELLAQRIESIDQVMGDGRFSAEMRRFLPQAVFNRTLGREAFSQYLSGELKALLGSLQQALKGEDGKAPFVM